MQQPYQETAPTNNTMAIISLVLGILGLVGVLPLIGSIGAIITGNMAKKEIEANPGLYNNEGMAKIGIILGWVGVALTVLAICAVISFSAFFFLIAASGEMGSILPALVPFV